MRDRSVTRKALWLLRSMAISQAQDCDRKIEKLEIELAEQHLTASKHRQMAEELKAAAEELGQLDLAKL